MRALLATKRGAATCLRAFHCPLRECFQLPFPDSLKFKLSVSNHIPFFSPQDSEENKGDYLTRTLQVTYNNVSDVLHWHQLSRDRREITFHSISINVRNGI